MTGVTRSPADGSSAGGSPRATGNNSEPGLWLREALTHLYGAEPMLTEGENVNTLIMGGRYLMQGKKRSFCNLSARELVSEV